MTIIKWMKVGGTIHHGHICRRDDQFEKLCLTQQREEPELVHELEGRQFCSSCLRRSLELSR